MVSMHAKDETANRYQGGVACYRISGQDFRTIGNIQNDDGAPCFLQAYYFGNEDQATICAGFYNGADALENQHNTQLFWDIAILPDGYSEIIVCYADYPKH